MEPIKIHDINPGRDRERAQSIRRVVLDIELADGQCDATVAGRAYIAKSGERVEVYETELPLVMAQVRTESDAQQLAMAETAFRGKRNMWRRRQEKTGAFRGKDDAEVEAIVEAQFPSSTITEYASTFNEKGLAPLKAANVVRASDIHSAKPKTITIDRYLELAADKRMEWSISAPVGPENAIEMANGRMADAMIEMVKQMQAGMKAG